MGQLGRGLLIAAVGLLIAGVPALGYRMLYDHSKRLRAVEEGKLYRCGLLTADGFADAVRTHRIRTVVNLMDDRPNPAIQEHWGRGGTVRERELCDRLGVRMVFIAPDLVGRKGVPPDRPRAIEEFLRVMDDPANHPVLIHCKAGLHRTGCLAAVYRMEYQGWTPHQAHEELKAHGFGNFACTAANDYVQQYVRTYRRGQRRPAAGERGPGQ